MIPYATSLTGRPVSYTLSFVFFFNDTATTEIYTLSLHDALPILGAPAGTHRSAARHAAAPGDRRSEEHTSELQSRRDLVCRLLLEKKKSKGIFPAVCTPVNTGSARQGP